jgi:hypothetical protein
MQAICHVTDMSHMTLTKLDEHVNRRRKFNPASKDDLKEFSYFQKYSKWKTSCPFYLEWPYYDIISMCQAKYSDYMLGKLTKSK